ncbi:hypothetical protein [Tenacibaculum sp. 190524A05c]|uniref:Oxygen tolerance protein BatD n=1 Tax=Tenacibaculum platacis TaxID=3137852 RepID=A0ABM9P676_9FLAO
MKRKQLLFSILTLLILTKTSAQDSLSLLTKKTEFIAGETVNLVFKGSKNKALKLFCSNSYGSTVLSPQEENERIVFKIPEFMSTKIGILNWKILGAKTHVSGKLSILATQKPVSLETYIGPPTIEAGDIDYAMIVVIPTDTLDNPVKTGSEVDIKEQFLQSERTNTIRTKDLISYRLVYAPRKSGRMLISSESYELNSKEFTLDILPAIGSNFKVYHDRNHGYADGNQITSFYTSIIRDKNNNIVTDGTFVEFFITNQDGNILKTSGTTIKGVATASIIHPDCKSTWKIKAFIDGIANSDVLQIKYSQVIDNIPVKFADDNRTITVGPLISFMKQMIPDGLHIELSIYKKGEFLNKIVEQSKDGFTTFKLNPNIYKAGDYKIEIKAACNTQNYKSIKLW